MLQDLAIQRMKIFKIKSETSASPDDIGIMVALLKHVTTKYLVDYRKGTNYNDKTRF